MNATEPPAYLSTAEIAARLGTTVNRVGVWITSGVNGAGGARVRLDARKIGGRYKATEAALEAFLRPSPRRRRPGRGGWPRTWRTATGCSGGRSETAPSVQVRPGPRGWEGTPLRGLNRRQCTRREGAGARGGSGWGRGRARPTAEGSEVTAQRKLDNRLLPGVRLALLNDGVKDLPQLGVDVNVQRNAAALLRTLRRRLGRRCLSGLHLLAPFSWSSHPANCMLTRQKKATPPWPKLARTQGL
jgi:hypothetical protein